MRSHGEPQRISIDLILFRFHQLSGHSQPNPLRCAYSRWVLGYMSLQDLMDSVPTILLNPLRNPMDRYALMREFEETLLATDPETTDVDALQQIAYALVEFISRCWNRTND